VKDLRLQPAAQIHKIATRKCPASTSLALSLSLSLFLTLLLLVRESPCKALKKTTEKNCREDALHVCSEEPHSEKTHDMPEKSQLIGEAGPMLLTWVCEKCEVLRKNKKNWN
jgi:hypothetical protein